MTTPSLSHDTGTAVLEQPVTTGRRRVRHLGEPGADRALCGARRGKGASPSEADLCVVCSELASSGRWTVR